MPCGYPGPCGYGPCNLPGPMGSCSPCCWPCNGQMAGPRDFTPSFCGSYSSHCPFSCSISFHKAGYRGLAPPYGCGYPVGPVGYYGCCGQMRC